MPRRHSYRYSSSYNRRYPYAPRSYRRYRRGGDGCLSDIQEFFTSLLRVMVLVGLTIVVLGFVITHFAQTIAFFTTIFPLYVNIDPSPLDTGQEQAVHLLKETSNMLGKGYPFHTARPIEKARPSPASFLNQTGHQRVALRAPQ